MTVLLASAPRWPLPTPSGDLAHGWGLIRRAVALGSLALACAAGPAAAGETYFVAGTDLPSGPATSGPATEIRLSPDRIGATPIAPTPDGGLLVANGCCILLYVTPSGNTSRVAGKGGNAFTGVPGPATEASVDIEDVAVLPDSGILIASGIRAILRVTPDGQIAQVAGSGRTGFAGDGGPASQAELAFPSGVAPLPDGGYLIADAANHRVRRVAPDGTISTVAGSGPAGGRQSGGFSGDGGPATSARLAFPTAVAVPPGGGFLIADTDNHRVRRVAADGTITTIAGTVGPVLSVSGAPDGAIYFSTTYGTWRLTEASLVKASRFFGDVAVEPDGGLLIADGASARIAWQPPASTNRLATRITPATLALAPQVTVHFRSTLAANARVTVKRGNGVVAQAEAQAQQGDNTLALPQKLKPGTLHRITITLTTAEGKIATAQTPFLPRGPLPVSLAKRLAADIADAESDGMEYAENVRSCKRMTERRVDCQTSSESQVMQTFSPCARILAFLLPANGRLHYREYRCPYTRHPRFFGGRLPVPPF